MIFVANPECNRRTTSQKFGSLIDFSKTVKKSIVGCLREKLMH